MKGNLSRLDFAVLWAAWFVHAFEVLEKKYLTLLEQARPRTNQLHRTHVYLFSLRTINHFTFGTYESMSP